MRYLCATYALLMRYLCATYVSSLALLLSTLQINLKIMLQIASKIHSICAYFAHSLTTNSY